jgi:DNA primase
VASSVEVLKGLNLVDFLTEHYRLRFRRVGGQYVCCSPFSEEKRPSFFVRCVNGHWLFKDFSSGLGGSIFDFVQIKENLGGFSEVLSYLRRVFSPMCLQAEEEGVELDGGETSYDVTRLYEQFKDNDLSVCREYLFKRGISEGLVDSLVADEILVHNRYQGRSYCCFAVRNRDGQLQCLDNHQVDGAGKFVLGRKSVFTQEFEALARAETVFVTEGIIDYLSVKTLEEKAWPGLALLGNQVSFDPELTGSARVIVSALDQDRGGWGGLYDLRELFPGRMVEVYNLVDHKDPNELLLATPTCKGRNLSPERKLKLYHEFIQSSNKSELARQWGIDRSYMYEIVRECEQSVVGTFTGRKPGRKPAGKPATLEEAWERIESLEKQYEREATQRELLYARGEFLKLRLKWAEIETAELRGEPVDESKGALKKKQIKKKKNRRR